MSKAFIYMITVTSLVIVLSILGILDSGTSQILSALNYDSPAGFKFSDFFEAIFDSSNGLLSLAGAVTGIIVGYLFSRSPESALIAGVVGLIGGWVVADLVKVMTMANEVFVGELTFLAILVKAVIFIILSGYLIAVIQLWRGND